MSRLVCVDCDLKCHSHISGYHFYQGETQCTCGHAERDRRVARLFDARQRRNFRALVDRSSLGKDKR